MSTNRTNIFKKAISSVLALSMAFALVAAMATSAFAAGATLSPSSSASLTESGTAKVGFVVSGTDLTIAGAKVTVKYDATQLDPTAVTLGDAFSGAIMVNNMDAPEGKLVIVFAQAANGTVKVDETAFSVTFDVLTVEDDSVDVTVAVNQAANAALADVSVDGGEYSYTVGKKVTTMGVDTSTVDPDEVVSVPALAREEGATEALLTNISSTSFDLEDIIALLIADVESLNVIDSSAKTDSTLVATGDVIQLLDGADNVLDTITLVVNGDVTGDGVISGSDMNSIQQELLGLNVQESLEGVYLDAALMGAEVLSGTQMVTLQRSLLGSIDL